MMNELADLLRRAGVERVYGVVEDSLQPIAEAISATDGMVWVEVPDEQAAALAAADEALASGRLAVCAGSYGPGRTGFSRGLSDAHRNGVPVLAVASHFSPETIVGGALDDLYPERLFAGCSHYCGLVMHASQLSWLARTAMQHALVRGGVSVLLLGPPLATAPRDVAGQSGSCRISGHPNRGRQSLNRAHGLPDKAGRCRRLRRGRDDGTC
jgi:pyruvate dehydrogenase (quinone)